MARDASSARISSGRRPLRSRPLLRLAVVAVVVVACVAAALGIAQAASGSTTSHSRAAHPAWMAAAGASGARWGWGKQMACGQHSFAARPLAAGTVQTVDQSAASFTIKTLGGATVTVTTSATTTLP